MPALKTTSRSPAMVASQTATFRRITLLAGSALVFVATVVGCGDNSGSAGSTDTSGKTALDTKGAAAKEAGAPKGVLPPKGKGKGMP